MLSERKKFMLGDNAYNFAKKLVQVIIPATASLYFGLASIWGLPGAEEVVGTLAVLATFLGVVLGISSREYNASEAAYDGKLNVTQSENGSKLFNLVLNDHPEAFEKKQSIRFKVDTSPEAS